MSNTKTIARNTGWYGLENIVSSLPTLFTSIAIARTLGPSKMGYIIYVDWIATWSAAWVDSVFLQRRTNIWLSFSAWATGELRAIFISARWFCRLPWRRLPLPAFFFWVLGDADADYKMASVLIVLSIWPSMVNSISAMANVATEKLSRICRHRLFQYSSSSWRLLRNGRVSSGAWSASAHRFSACASVDFLVRLFPTMKRILAWETTHVHPEGLRERMIAFAWQSVASMIVAMIVWDRSEVFLLKHLCSDIRQVAYYSWHSAWPNGC